MPDIFGREKHDYRHYGEVNRWLETQEWGRVDSYLESRAARSGRKAHDFQAGSGGYLTAAADDLMVLGYATDNLESVQTMINETMYDEYRLPDYVPILTDIPEGAQSYVKLVMDSWGRGAFIEASGSEMQNVGTGLRRVDYPLFYAGIAAQWMVEEVRQSAMAGVSLTTEVLKAATRGAMEHIETVGLQGDATRGLKGFLTLDADASPSESQVKLMTAGMTFAGATADQLLTLLHSAVNQIISDTKGILGRTYKMPLTIFMPMQQYLLVQNTPRSSDNDRSVWNYFAANNGWTALSGRQPDLQPIIELDGAGGSNTDRMIVAIKSPMIYEMPMSISPRAMSPQLSGLTIKVPMEYKIGGVNVMRPRGIVYMDGI